MNPNTEDLVKQSLEDENAFSSSEHAIGTLVKEIEPKVNEYKIPSKYNKDTLRIILVNTEKYYVYWEVSNNTLQKYDLDLNKDKLYFKIKDENKKELFTFDSSFALGEYFVNHKFENINICAIVEIEYENKRIELMSSNMVHTFSSKVNLPDKNSEVWIKKVYSWREIVKSTVDGSSLAMSSAKYLEELKKIEYITSLSEERSFSSSTFLGENR